MSALIGRERLLQLYQHAIQRATGSIPMAMPCGSRRVAAGSHKKSPRYCGGWLIAGLLNQAAAKLAATKSQFTSFSR